MRDCVRSDRDQAVVEVKMMPLLCPGASQQTAIERVSEYRQGLNSNGDAYVELVQQDSAQQVFLSKVLLQNGHSADFQGQDQRSGFGTSSSSTSIQKGGDNDRSKSAAGASKGVPPVSNWFQVYQNGRDAPKESARFEEVSSSRSMWSGQAGGEFRTPGQSARESPRQTPRESPRAPEEGVREQTEELIYEGTYLGTMKHGMGKLRSKQYTYDGDFQNDAKHGIGVLLWDDGRRYEGGFAENKFHGMAAMHWPDGRKYIGQYIQDRKHGDGTFSWQDGRRYEGQWVSGKRDGMGTYTNAKGVTRRGSWQLDRPIQWEDPVTLPVVSPLPLGSLPSPAGSPSKQPVPLKEQTDVEDNRSVYTAESGQIQVSNL